MCKYMDFINGFCIDNINQIIRNKENNVVYKATTPENWPYRMWGDFDPTRIILSIRKKNGEYKNICLAQNGDICYDTDIKEYSKAVGTFRNMYFEYVVSPWYVNWYRLRRMKTHEILKEYVTIPYDEFFANLGYFIYGDRHGILHIVDDDFNEVIDSCITGMNDTTLKDGTIICKIDCTHGFLFLNNKGDRTEMMDYSKENGHLLCDFDTFGYAFFFHENDSYKIDKNLKIHKINEEYNICRRCFFSYVKKKMFFTDIFINHNSLDVAKIMYSSASMFNLGYTAYMDIKETWNKIIFFMFGKH